MSSVFGQGSFVFGTLARHRAGWLRLGRDQKSGQREMVRSRCPHFSLYVLSLESQPFFGGGWFGSTRTLSFFLSGILFAVDMLSQNAQPRPTTRLSIITIGVRFENGTASLPAFSSCAVKYSTSMFLPPMRYGSRR